MKPVDQFGNRVVLHIGRSLPAVNGCSHVALVLPVVPVRSDAVTAFVFVTAEIHGLAPVVGARRS